jgi:hypothetical protein
MLQLLLRRLRLRYKTSAWASGGRAPRRRGAATAGEEQLGRCSAEQSKYYRLYLYSGDLHARRTRTCCRTQHPLQPAALAFVPYGFVLVRVRVQWLGNPRRDVPSTSSGRWRSFAAALMHVSAVVAPPAPEAWDTKTSEWASGDPAGSRCLAACSRRWRALLLCGPPRR